MVLLLHAIWNGKNLYCCGWAWIRGTTLCCVSRLRQWYVSIFFTPIATDYVPVRCQRSLSSVSHCLFSNILTISFFEALYSPARENGSRNSELVWQATIHRLYLSFSLCLYSHELKGWEHYIRYVALPNGNRTRGSLHPNPFFFVMGGWMFHIW